MATVDRRPLLLSHLFSAPLVRETMLGGDENEPGFLPVKQHNYVAERDVITSTLERARRGIEFRSEVADANNFLTRFTGCRVLHFTWNGERDQEQVMFEDSKGVASPVTEDKFQSWCATFITNETFPEVVVLTAASAKLVSGTFIRAGISNVVAVETSEDHTITLDFTRAFYSSLAEGRTLRDSFDAGVRSLPDNEKGRCVLLPNDEEHSVSPFDDAARECFVHLTPRVSSIPRKAGPGNFYGREIQVQEVYTYMKHHIKVITIRGKPGIGKTEVALRACEYASERHLFSKILRVSLEDSKGKPITTLQQLATRIARAFGISEQEEQDDPEGLLGCIQSKCGSSSRDLLLVLDGCPPYFTNEKNERIPLSSVVEQLCQRVSHLQYIVTVVTQVGIAKEKVVNVGRLSDLAAAELFVASAPREVTVEELRGGMLVSGPQVRDAECMRLFAGSGVMIALGGHPGAIVAASGMLKEGHLLRHEDDFVTEINVQLRRHKALETEFATQLRECPQTRSDFVIEREWGGRQAREKRRSLRPRSSPSRQKAIPRAPEPKDGILDGEHWWGLAVEQHTGGAGVVSNLVPWGALCKHSLAKFFRLVLGEESLNRPLVAGEFQTLGNSADLWRPYPPPALHEGEMTVKIHFLGSFWPWFKAATLLLKHSGYWGFQRYPVMCGLTTTRFDGEKLLQGRPKGTFLLRVSSTNVGGLAVMYVKEHLQVESVLIKEPLHPADQGKFEMNYGKEKIRASLKDLILYIPGWTHLFPDTPKLTALTFNSSSRGQTARRQTISVEG